MHSRLNFFVLVEHANKILLFCQHIFTSIQADAYLYEVTDKTI